MKEARPYFVNGLPFLYEQLKKEGHEDQGKLLVERFLKQSFNRDFSEKIDRFLKTGVSPPIRADLKYFPIYAELLDAYVNGLFYSTVMLAGTLCERICFDILSLSKIQLDGKDLTGEQIAHFNELNFRRINRLLFAWNLIEKESKKTMDQIYDKRTSYVHPKMKGIDPEKDSLEVLKKVREVLFNEFVMKSRRRKVSE